ncbi:hypothetical protein NECAME_14124 [Necator americanus]|uniref:Uncharacterized protein n=1 Tax=Necator americanus TaxID=51031 RepID=W2SQA3_NECAM|nr:hypothetical protein NECAME_14124 [Necator americanus]ETN71698.1 hypothetical protein NECAME_14124 [Necator americanus]
MVTTQYFTKPPYSSALRTYSKRLERRREEEDLARAVAHGDLGAPGPVDRVAQGRAAQDLAAHAGGKADLAGYVEVRSPGEEDEGLGEGAVQEQVMTMKKTNKNLHDGHCCMLYIVTLVTGNVMTIHQHTIVLDGGLYHQYDGTSTPNRFAIPCPRWAALCSLYQLGTS